MREQAVRTKPMANENSSREKSVRTLSELPTAGDATGATNRDQVSEMALKLAFGAEKTAPLFPSVYASKAGSFTYSSVRAGLTTTHPELQGDEKTKMVNKIMNSKDATAAAAVIQLLQEGFRFSRFNGRQLKSGTRTVSIGMTNARDKKAEPAKKLEDYSPAELREMADLREKAMGAKTIEVAPAVA